MPMSQSLSGRSRPCARDPPSTIASTRGMASSSPTSRSRSKPAESTGRSGVIEAGPVQADERLLATARGPGHGLVGQLVGVAGQAQARGEVAAAVVALEEVAARVAGSGGQAPVPHVGDEQGDVA